MQRSFVWIVLSALLAGAIGLGLFSSRAVAAPPSTGDISGVVLAGGSPSAGATVTLSGGVGYIDWVAQTTTDSAGKFKLRRIAAGSYNANASKLSLSQVCFGNAPVTVVAGQTTNVTIEMTCQ